MKNKGIIPINKPAGWTSFDVVNKIKHMVKPLKVGHLGTLDPMATGVLLVTVGKATKLFDIMQNKLKTYIATFSFDYLTDTLDSTGETIVSAQIEPIKLEDLQKVVKNFIGEISQIPPRYSAKSINGTRAYDLARRGEEFELKPKNVYVQDIKILELTGTFAKLEITCGSGTYIRSLGRDIGQQLGVYGTMTSLIRTEVSNFKVENCLNIEDLNKDNVADHIMKIQEFLSFPTLNLSDEETFKLINGQILDIKQNDGEYLAIHNENEVAIVKINANKAKMSIFLD